MVLMLGRVAPISPLLPRGWIFFIFWFDFWFVAFSHHHLSRVWTLWKWGDQNWSERLPRMVAEYGYGVVPGRSIECHCFCHRLLPLGLSAPLPVPVMSHL